MPVHALNVEAPIEQPVDRARPLPRTCTGARLSPARQREHAATSRALAAAVLAAGASYGTVARALAVNASRVEDLADPEHPAALTLRDIRAMASAGARSVAIALLRAELEALEEEAPASCVAPERHGLRVGTACGAMQSAIDAALADGEVSEPERREIVRAIGEVERRAAAARRDLGGSR